MTPFMEPDVEVLANDTGTDLQVCRLGPVPDADLEVNIWSHVGSPGDRDIPPGGTYLYVTPQRELPAGDVTVEYAVCDRHRTDWATLTIEVRRVGAARIAPATVRFTNPLDQRIELIWAAGGERQHLVRLGPAVTRDVEVGHRAVWWAAFVADDEVPADYGKVGRTVGGTAPATPAPGQPAESPDADLDTSAPVTAPDHVTLDYYDSVDLDVLANDSDDHPEDLAICRVDVPPGVGLDALPAPWWTRDPSDSPRLLDVGANAADTAGGTFEITYYACDREQLTPGTLTVTVREFREPRVHRVIGRPGAVRFHNRGYRTINVQYFRAGHYSEKHHLFVDPGEAGTLRVPYDHLFYFVDTRIGPLTHGRVRDVRQDG